MVILPTCLLPLQILLRRNQPELICLQVDKMAASCVIHCSDVGEHEEILPFSDARWETVRKYSSKWAILDGRERERGEEIAKRPDTDRSSKDGYHE